MLELVILTLVEAKANYLASTFLHPSSLPILLSHPSKIDNVEEPFHNCLKIKFEGCEDRLRVCLRFDYFAETENFLLKVL